MPNTRMAYKGYSLIPMALPENGQHAAMLIIEDRRQVQRATGVLGYFPNADLAYRAAIEYGMAEVDRCCAQEQSHPDGTHC